MHPNNEWQDVVLKSSQRHHDPYYASSDQALSDKDASATLSSSSKSSTLRASNASDATGLKSSTASTGIISNTTVRTGTTTGTVAL